MSVADCAAVYEGVVGCCGVGCPNAAIAQAALARYTSDLARAGTCNPPPVCRPPPAATDCNTGRVACRDGLCAFDVPDAGTNAD